MHDAFGIPDSVLVVGGTSDIGVAIASELARRGTRKVGLACRSATPESSDPGITSPVDTAAQALQTLGASVIQIPFDASDADPNWAHQEISSNDWDCVIVAFGALGDQNTMLKDLPAAADLIDTNFRAATLVCLSATAAFTERGQGQLVVLSSVAAVRARSANFLYASTKAGLDVLATGLADQLHGSGVTVLTVRPGFVRSKMTAGLADQPFATTPDAVANDVVDALLRRTSAIVWSPRKLQGVYLILRSLPSFVWRRMSS